MKKQIQAAALALCALMIFATVTSCGKQEKTATEQPALEAVEYSNLTDEDSRKQLSELLTDAGIEESRIAALLNRVEQFNASVKSEWLTDGFESAAPTDTKYDPYEMQDEWTAANGSFPGYNCLHYSIWPVQRIHHSRSRPAGGTGQGLALYRFRDSRRRS